MSQSNITKAGLVDTDALDFFKSKGLKTGFDYRDVWLYEHSTAFTVAKMMDEDMLAEVQNAVSDAIKNATPFRDFQKRLKPYLMAKGWWGESIEIDPIDGKPKIVQLGSTRRLETIYKVNRRTAAAAGQWQRIQDNKKVFPYLKYMGSTATNKRDAHKPYYGMILPVDDVFWQTHYPPNGYGCQCQVRQITARRAEREGISESPAVEWVDYTNPRTGKSYVVPKDVHPTFAHNHSDRLTAVDTLYQEKHGDDAYAKMTAEREAYLKSAVDAIKLPISLTALPNKAPPQAVKRLLKDPTDGVEKLSEAQAAAAWQSVHKQRLERYDLDNPTPPDFLIMEKGVARDKLTTIDFMYTMDTDNDYKIAKFNEYFAKNAEHWGKTKDRIQEHLQKADIVPMDLHHLNALNRAKLLRYVLSLPKEQIDKIRLLVRESK